MRSASVVPIAAACVVAASLLPAGQALAEDQFSYMEPTNAGVSLRVLLTSGDTVGGVVWPGVPDGIGVLRDGKNIVVFTNHELSATNATAAATARANGAASASTVSAINIDTATQSTTAVRDLLGSVTFYNYATGQYGAPGAPAGAAAKDEFGTPNHTKALNRFCSSHMAQPGDLAYWMTDADGKKVLYGYTGPAYFTGEEGGDESRAFVMDTNGNMSQLPALGLAAWENLVVAPKTGIRTVVMSDEDGAATDSQLYMYVGEKTQTGSWVDKAGLANGTQYVLNVTGIANDNAFRASIGKGKAAPVTFQPINTTVNGKEQNAQARVLGTELSRVEDGAWDPMNPNDFYFVTTESNKDPKATAPNPATPKITRDGGALWRLRYNDVKDPLAGATLTMLLDGTEAPYLNKPDNIDVDAKGNVLIQEDPGNNDHVSRLVSYRVSDGKVGVLAKFKDVYFSANATQPITKDEESSGVTDVTSFLRTSESDSNSYFVLDAQVHASAATARPDLSTNPANAAALKAAIEGGQLYLMTVSDWSKVYGG